MSKDHTEGFEKEEKFSEIFYLARKDNPRLHADTVKMIISHFAPDFLEGLFVRRPCVRKLKYVGYGCNLGHEFFEIGKIYESVDFDGATYTIKGYGDGKRRIGSAYFEWVD